MGTPRVFCAKSAEAIENGRVELFALAQERAQRAKDSGVRKDWRGWAVRVTTKGNIPRALSSRGITLCLIGRLWKSSERSNGWYWSGAGSEETSRLSPGFYRLIFKPGHPGRNVNGDKNKIQVHKPNLGHPAAKRRTKQGPDSAGEGERVSSVPEFRHVPRFPLSIAHRP
jgi:hypothetical protein